MSTLEEYENSNGENKPSCGLLYLVFEESAEGASPVADQLSIVAYKGESVDQYYNHSNFSTEQTDFTIIKPEDMVSFSGLGEGVQLMKEGDRYEFVLPSSLALASGRVFTFDFELLSVIQEDQEEFRSEEHTSELQS